MSEGVVVVPADTPDTVVVVPGGEYARVDHTHDAGDVVVPHVHDDLYYTEAETDALLADKAAAVHTHDGRYYTEGEVDAALGTKVSKSGDTMTGNLTVEKDDARAQFKNAGGTSAYISMGASGNFLMRHVTAGRTQIQLTAAGDLVLGQSGSLVNIATATAVTVPAPTAADHAARKQDVDAKVSKSGDEMTGNVTFTHLNPKVIFKADGSFAGFVVQRADGTRRFVMESDNNDSGDGKLSFGTYNDTGGGFREAFFIRNRPGEGSGLFYVPSYFVAGNDARVDGVLTLNGGAPTADNHAARKIDVDNARIQTVQSIEDIPVDATTDDVFAVYDPLSTISGVSRPTIVGLSTGYDTTASPTPVQNVVGLQAGDWLLLHYVNQSSSTTGDATIPGFTRVGPAYTDPTAGLRFQGLYAKKVIDPASEPLTYEVTVPWAATDRKVINLMAIRGADPITPVAASSGYSAEGASASPTIPGLTAPAKGLFLGFLGYQVGSTVTTPISTPIGTVLSDWRAPNRDGDGSATGGHVVQKDVADAEVVADFDLTLADAVAQSSTFSVVIV